MVTLMTNDAPAQASVATWLPLDDNGLAELRVNGKRITSSPSYPAAEEAAQRINAALSPPPTVGAEDEATCNGGLHVEPIPRAPNTGRYLAETNDGRLLYLNHANEWHEMPNILKTATRPAPAAVDGQRVKALEWESGDGIVHDALSWRATVKALGLTYCVVEHQWWLVGEHGVANLCASDDEAKAAAQADYEARIRACLATDKEGA